MAYSQPPKPNSLQLKYDSGESVAPIVVDPRWNLLEVLHNTVHLEQKDYYDVVTNKAHGMYTVEDGVVSCQVNDLKK